MWPNPRETADLVTLTKEKLHLMENFIQLIENFIFLCSAAYHILISNLLISNSVYISCIVPLSHVSIVEIAII